MKVISTEEHLWNLVELVGREDPETYTEAYDSLADALAAHIRLLEVSCTVAEMLRAWLGDPEASNDIPIREALKQLDSALKGLISEKMILATPVGEQERNE